MSPCGKMLLLNIHSTSLPKHPPPHTLPPHTPNTPGGPGIVGNPAWACMGSKSLVSYNGQVTGVSRYHLCEAFMTAPQRANFW